MIFSRLGRLVRSELTAVRRRWEGRSRPPAEGPARDERRETGGPRRPAPPDPLARHYARLEIPEGSDLDEVRRAYRRLMRRYHPDRHSLHEAKAKVANEVAMALTESYEAITHHLEGRRPRA